MKNGTLIFNPGSGRGKGSNRAGVFKTQWEKRLNGNLLLRPTRSYEDIRVAAKEAYKTDTIPIFLGGDGTLSESIQGIAELVDFKKIEKPVGFLSGGSGDSYMRDFGISSFEKASNALLEAVETDSTIEADTGLIDFKTFNPETPDKPGKEDKRIFINIWGLGLLPEIAEQAMKMRYLGSNNYTAATLIKLLKHKPTPLPVEVDGNEKNYLCNFLSLSNNRFTGGKMDIAPFTRINDGKLFIVCPEIKTRTGLFSLFPSIFKGKHINSPDVNSGFVQNLKFKNEKHFYWNIDGDLGYGFNPKISVKPGYFKLYMPKELYDRNVPVQ
ncbi:MAG: diacylglycerol kinase family protein [Spirochaetota bacterium]|nr:diacylglycerol kinase family protein [Spirochaetota bacterium]